MKQLALILAGTILTAAAQQPPPRQTVTIKGVVLQLGSRQPVPKVVVKLSRDYEREAVGVVTGADGRFEFENVPDGRYELVASRNGYIDSAYGQRGPSGSPQELVIQAGIVTNNIELILTPTGAVSGRVVDNTGDPLMNVIVAASKYAYEGGERVLVPEKTAQSNDLGEFRVFGLRPGQYLISAVPQKSGNHRNQLTSDGAALSFDSHHDSTSASSPFGSSRLPGEGYVPMYYPGTPDPHAAVRVEVGPGADLHGVDFTLSLVKTRRVRGSVINGVTGQLANSADIQLVPHETFVDLLSISTENGRFEFNEVLPGSYEMFATARPALQVYEGHTIAEVGSTDLDEIRITVNPQFQVEGNFITDKGPLLLKGSLPPVIFLNSKQKLKDGDISQHACQYPDVKETHCVFFKLTEGDYALTWGLLPSGSFVKSVMLGSTDVLKGPVHLDSKTTSLQVVISSTAGAVEGNVRDSRSRAVSGAQVIIVPDAARRDRADLYMTAETDNLGHYQIQGIPPGDYTLFSWEDVEDGIWRDPDFIRRNEASGKFIHISESSHESLDFIAVPFAF